ncbi:chitin-binding domain protein cbd-1-like [Bombus vosnesenskii]|uniref:Chitin-binding domain protein cbd-1-like n=1 Tax=Bombus vosnesenskii TaxID=207650 RepID=A0A6J3K205_9HYME|nr:chitin-binding domain protein cbd-1-like [Bombus vosnesenskii]
MADSIFSSISDLLLLVSAVLAVTGNAFAEIHEIPTKCPESADKTVQLAHKHDCTKFYECSNGQKLLSNCPEFAPGQKLHFDPELQNCTFPWEANCASRAPDCSKDEFIQPHSTNCSLYYKCENGEKVLKMCDEGQLFNFDSLECVDKDAAKCKVYDSCPTGKLLEAVLLPHYRESLYYECIDGQDAVRRCPSGHVFDNGLRQCVSKVYCPGTGTKRISHETDCGLFYECMDGVKVEKACEDGLSFDESKGICTWSPRHECSKEKNIIDCPPEGYTFLPHECSCTKYYSCEDGERFIQQCPEGMMYDYIRKVCDLSRTAICWNQMYTDDNYLDPNCYNSTDCPIYSHARFPHKECRFYYECKGGAKCLRRCSEGHVFNPNLQLCDLPKNVPGCGGGGSNEPDDTTPNNTDNECTWCNCNNCIIRSAYPEDCNLYYQCENGQKVIKRCPRNLVFDHINQICDYQENVHCIPTTTNITTLTPTPTTPTTKPPRCIEGQRLHHECQCSEYYECHHERYQWFRCSPGKWFDWILSECVAQDIANCYHHENKDCEGTCSSSTSRLPHKDCDKYCTCYRGTTTVETCPRHMYYDRGTQNCQWLEDISYWRTQCNPSDCSFGINYVPHECYCDGYYNCLGNSKTIEWCGDGQHFDYREERCVDSRYVHCYVSPSCEAIKKCGTCEATKHNTSSYADDCQRYCRCSGRNVHIEHCASGLYYDIQSGECAWPENVNLTLGHCPLVTDCTRTSKFIPHNCQCELYYECIEGVKYLAECPGASSFDYVLGTCVNKEPHCYHEFSTPDIINSCIGHCPEQTSSSPIVRLQHKDCNRYCVCSMGAPYIVNCPGCSQYDSRLQTCVPSNLCNCDLRAKKTLWSDIPFVSNFL